MEDRENKIIANLAFSPEKAELLYNQSRHILIKAEMLIRFQRMVEEELGPMTSELVFKAAFDIGSGIGKRHAQGPALSPRQMIESMLDSAGQVGWAKLRLKKANDFPHMVVLEAFNSAFASAYGQSEKPVCHMIKGIFSGAFSQMIGPLVDSQETECLAMGSPKCVFEFRLKH